MQKSRPSGGRVIKRGTPCTPPPLLRHLPRVRKICLAKKAEKKAEETVGREAHRLAGRFTIRSEKLVEPFAGRHAAPSPRGCTSRQQRSLTTRHPVRLQALGPHFGRVLREHLLEHARDDSVRRRLSYGLPRALVGELRAAEADGERMPLLLRLDRYFDPAGGAAIFAIAGIGAGAWGHPAIIAPGLS